MKSLWSSIQDDPVFMQRVNGWLTILWIAMIPISIATGWIKTYVASLSLYRASGLPGRRPAWRSLSNGGVDRHAAGGELTAIGGP